MVPIRYCAISATDGWSPTADDTNQPGVQWDKRVPAVGVGIPEVGALMGIAGYCDNDGAADNRVIHGLTGQMG